MTRSILGLETEYAFVFSPQVGSPAPVQEKVYDCLARKLRKEYLAQEASYRKGGFFLANGGLIHYEPESDDLTQGLLEMATPECRSPLEVVAHHRAQERIIEELLPGVTEALEEEGFSGELVIGKNSSDYLGHTFGTHENYQVEDVQLLRHRILLAAMLGIYQIIKLPITLIQVALRCLSLVGGFLPFLVVRVQELRKRSSNQPFDRKDFQESNRVLEFWQRLLDGLTSLAQKAGYLEQHYLLPALGRLVAPLVFRRFQGDLFTFLVTRLIYTGPGWIETSAQGRPFRFVLSQKAPSIQSVFEVYHDPECKPIIDLKNIFQSFLGPLERMKRLHISFSDSNMSEYATWLKVGTTDLVVRMLGAGKGPRDIRLEDVLEGLRIVNGDVAMEEPLKMANGEYLLGIEIQGFFLESAREYVASLGDDRHPEDEAVLRGWEEVLRVLRQDPRNLEDRLDWIAKKSLLDEAMGPDGWDLSRRVAPVVHWLEKENLGLGRVVDSPTQVEEFFSRRLKPLELAQLRSHLTRSELPWNALPKAYRLYYQAKKIDLKYHQIGRDGGYHAQLERDGFFRRVLDDREIRSAMHHPPEGTRASVRAHYAREAMRLDLEVLVGWDRIIVPDHFMIIPLDDPRDDRIPMSLDALKDEGLARTFSRMLLFLPRRVSLT